jgi:hypothetical protein
MVYGARTAILGEHERLALRHDPYSGSSLSTPRFFRDIIASHRSVPLASAAQTRSILDTPIGRWSPPRSFPCRHGGGRRDGWRCSFWRPSSDRARSVNPGRAPQVEKAFDRDAPHRRHEQRMDATAAAADRKGGERNANQRDAPSPRRKAMVRPHSRPS